MRRILIFLPLLAILVAGCTTPVLIPVSGPNPDVTFRIQDDSLGTEQRPIAGYYSLAGDFVPVEGYVMATGDSLRFIFRDRPARGLERGQVGSVDMVARDSVAAVKGSPTDVPKSIALGLGVTALMLGAIGLAMASSLDEAML